MLAQVIVDGTIAGAIYGLVALGFGLVFRVCKFFHLAHGALYALGPYFAYVFIHSYGWGPPFAVPVAVFAAAGVGCAIEIFIYRPLRHRDATALMMLIVSLGIYIVIQNILSAVFGDAPLSVRTGPILEGLKILSNARITQVQLLTICACALLSLCVWLLLRYSLLGKEIRAVASDSGLSVVLGIDHDRVFVAVVTMASILAAIAGILVGYDTDLVPSMGFSALLMASAAMLLGGLDNVWGSLFGGFVIGAIQHGSAIFLPTQWQDTSIFLVMIASLLIKPRGLLGPDQYNRRH